MSAHSHTSALFHPRAIAVLGASRTEGKIGNTVVKNLLKAKFSGTIYPINPYADKILGIPCLSNIGLIPAQDLPLDLAIICLPAQMVYPTLMELGKLKTKAVIIMSAGFKEIGSTGAALEQQIKDTAQYHHMAVLGPNSLGLVYTGSGLHATWIEGAPTQGDIGFFSQSGSFATAIFDWAQSQNIGFSAFVTLGNKAVIDESDILAYLADDPNTKVIIGYLESIANGQRFLHNAQIATRKKPVILLKSGRTAAGARAASAHTGMATGADMAFDAAFKQSGIIRANEMEELFSMAHAFASQPLPTGSGIAIVTNAAGPGILATDACEAAGLQLARLSAETSGHLQNLLPTYGSSFNPVDVTVEASAEEMTQAVQAVLQDPAVHMLLFMAAPTTHASLSSMALQLAPLLSAANKPVFSCLMGGNSTDSGKQIFIDAGIPCFSFPEPAIKAIAAMYKQSLWKDNPMPVEVNYRRDISKAKAIIDTVKAENNLEITGLQALNLLKAYEMPHLEAKLARTSDEACQVAKQLGFPVAVKIASPQIAHKTDVQGIELNVQNIEQVKNAFLEVTTRAAKMHKNAYISGCIIQKMGSPHARELHICCKRDPHFGPVVTFAVAGIHAETFKDIACRLAPLSLDDVHEMIREIKAFPLLAGMHGQQPVTFTAIEDMLLIISQMAMDLPELSTIECAPVLVDEQGAYAVDMRATLATN